MHKTALRPPWALLAAVLFVYCLLNSAAVAESCGAYLKLCGERVVPSLFVFSVLAAMICRSKGFYRLCAVLPCGGTEIALLIMGMLGGFPLGATVAYELYANGKISKRQAEYLCAFTNNPSVSFTVSYVGGVLGSRRMGALLALLTFLSAAVTAIILRYTFLKKDERHIAPPVAAFSSTELAAAIRDGSITMLVICGCVVFFGGLSQMLPEGLRGFLELSGGIAICRTPTKAAVLLGFSGVSVMCQVSAVCRGKLSAAPFVLAKLMQSAIMGVFAYFLFDYGI